MHNIKELQQIIESWEILEKEAGTVKDITETGKSIVDFGWNKLVIPSLIAIPALSILGGMAYSNLTSPKALAKNADKLALQNALDTEIASKKREIADILQKRRVEKEKKYDRFV